MFMVYGLIELLFTRKKGNNYQMFLEGKQQCLYKCDQRSKLHYNSKSNFDIQLFLFNLNYTHYVNTIFYSIGV